MLDLTIDTSEDEKTLGYLTIELQNISEKIKKFYKIIITERCYSQ